MKIGQQMQKLYLERTTDRNLTMTAYESLIALPQSIFRRTVMIFKILRGVKQSAPNAVSRNGWKF